MTFLFASSPHFFVSSLFVFGSTAATVSFYSRRTCCDFFTCILGEIIATFSSHLRFSGRTFSFRLSRARRDFFSRSLDRVSAAFFFASSAQKGGAFSVYYRQKHCGCFSAPFIRSPRLFLPLLIETVATFIRSGATRALLCMNIKAKAAESAAVFFAL